MRYCETCGKPLPDSTGAGRPRRYCSAACRQKAQRQRSQTLVTPEMAMADRWLRWKLAKRGDGTTKRPLTVNGGNASSTDSSTWSSLSEAENSRIGDGLGFALGSGFACVDLDHCYDSRNHLTDWAKSFLAPVMGKTYIEISPSGDGLHIWGLMPETLGIKVRDGLNVEAYSQGRYMTYTGRRFKDSPAKLTDLRFLFWLAERLK